MTPNGEGWYYLGLKKLSVLLRGITSKHVADFYSLNYLHLFRTKSKLKSHKIFCENKDLCSAVMTFEGTKILEFSHYRLFMQVLNL